MEAHLKFETWPIGKLVEYARNPRKNDHAVDKIAGAIKEFGFRVPVVAKSDGLVVDGHLRLKAAKKLGLKDIPVILADDMTDAQIKAFRISVNRMAEFAEWDNDLLALELGELGELGFDLELTGFTDEEIKALMPVEVTEGLTDEDNVPEVPADPVTKPGDVWVLGKHRLMCGDSTSVDAVDALMQGGKADMVFTDPPYNIGFGGTMSDTTVNGERVPHKPANTKHDEIHNDKKESAEFKDFMLSVLSVIKTYCIGGYYICFSSSTLDELLNPLAETGIGWKSIIIWNKNQSPMGGGHFRRKYEPIAYGYFENNFYGREYAEDDVWDVDRTRKNDLHPTMKPVELVERAIGYSSRKGQTVLDLFGGSGSTMIACEKTNRHARLMELDPKYCDVIVKRWQDFTGQIATLEADGRTFDEVKNGNEKAQN